MPSKFLLIPLALFIACCKSELPPQTRAPWSPTPSFWIWNQTSPLPVGAQPLYVQVAEFTRDSHRALQPIPASQHHIAVVRLPTGRSTMEDLDFKDRLFSYLVRTSPQRLQIDYDCATMNLGLYADFLTELQHRHKPLHLSITALASWIDSPDFETLSRSVDEVCPMFYDLEPDAPLKILQRDPAPLVDSSTISWIEKWQQCPVTWRAGLTNFQRLSLFQSSGELIGHFQKWDPDHLDQFKLLKAKENELIFQIKHPGNYQGVTLKPENVLVWRRPDESFTSQAIKAAHASGASGIIWFTHPDSAPVAWHSVDHLNAMTNEDIPRPNLKTTVNADGSLTLENHGPGDLLFQHRQVILESPAKGDFGAATPGTFQSISAPGSSLVRPHLARSIALSFSNLRSGQSLSSGPGLVRTPEEWPPSIRIHPFPP